MLIYLGRAGNKGTAVTFITPEQDRYSIGIYKAMKDSAQPIPEELQKLVDSFNEKVKSGKEKASGSGFGGKGLERLDQERDAARARERKTHKTGDEPDEDENEEKGKEEKSDDLITKAASSVQAASAPTPLAGVPKGIDLDGKIVVHKTEATGSKNALDKVGQAVASIHDRLSKNKELRQGSYNTVHSVWSAYISKEPANSIVGVPIDNKGPDAGAFHATLEINDFPQKARWAVTNRTNVAKILVSHSASPFSQCGTCLIGLLLADCGQMEYFADSEHCRKPQLPRSLRRDHFMRKGRSQELERTRSYTFLLREIRRW